jgi:hypothetical protein
VVSVEVSERRGGIPLGYESHPAIAKRNNNFYDFQKEEDRAGTIAGTARRTE